MWKKNLDKKFSGVEECFICYSIFHINTYQIPKLSCHTCRKKFHAPCLVSYLCPRIYRVSWNPFWSSWFEFQGQIPGRKFVYCQWNTRVLRFKAPQTLSALKSAWFCRILFLEHGFFYRKTIDLVFLFFHCLALARSLNSRQSVIRKVLRTKLSEIHKFCMEIFHTKFHAQQGWSHAFLLYLQPFRRWAWKKMTNRSNLIKSIMNVDNWF